MMVLEDPLENLANLTNRQREVLQLVCAGLTYKVVGDQLHITEGSVKSHMGNIYVKLGLSHLSRVERVKAVKEDYCPVLQELELPPSDKPESEEPEPVPGSVQDMVEDDEQALVMYRKPEVIMPNIEVIPPSPDRRGVGTGLRLVLVGMLLGALALGAIFLTLRELLPGEAETPIAATLADAVAPVTEVTVVLTPTPLPTVPALPTATPIILEVIVTQEVIVVATATQPSAPTLTPIPPSSDTQPGTILDVGQTWEQDEVELTLLDIEFYPGRGEVRGELTVSWRFVNNSPQEIILSLMYDDFSALDNFGNRLKVLKFSNEAFTLEGFSVALKPGEAFNFSTPGASGFQIPIVVDLTNDQLTEVIVIATRISRIENAQWRIPIFH